MALRYTGRAEVLVIDGTTYRPGDVVPISKADALRMAARSHLHTFEDVPAATAPKPAPKSAD